MDIKTYTRVLTIAGSDSGGGAGIQADIKTMSALGTYGFSAITCITAQNTLGVVSVEQLSLKIIEDQINAVLSDIGADAIKIGMLGSPEIAHLVAEILKRYDIPIVLDPVLVATSGDVLSHRETVDVILNELVPMAAVITPNLEEAEALSGYSDERSWDVLRNKGCKALLLKGGHGEGEVLKDVLFTPNKIYIYENERIITNNTHGTGCSLSSAIASYLALGEPMDEAVSLAIKYIHKAIAVAADYTLGGGHGPIHHFYRYW